MNAVINTFVEESLIGRIVDGSLAIAELSDTELVGCLEYLNAAYRRGTPIVSDTVYDRVFLAEMERRDPDHPFLNTVEEEPEDAFVGDKIRHRVPMLSTAKAYTQSDINSFVTGVLKVAARWGLDATQIEVVATPKLDGLAGHDLDGVLATRGNGLTGTNITRIFDVGVIPVGGRGHGLGELVVDQAYYESELVQFGLKHPRNFVSGFIGADTLKEHHQAALGAGAVKFIPYSHLDAWKGSLAEFSVSWAEIMSSLRENCPILTDGIVVSVSDPRLRDALGNTRHHPRWNLAVKDRGEVRQTTVTAIEWETGRTGRIIPTVIYAPVELSGATLQRTTGHTAARAVSSGVGVGAVIEVVRAGEVVPYLDRVIQRVPVEPPTACPSCGTTAEWDGEHLVCRNTSGCSAQVEASLWHFFHTLGNVDQFGDATIQRLVAAGHNTLPAIYRLQEPDFVQAGFGPGQARNLVNELARSRTEPVEDWRFLGAFGIRHLGRGDSMKLLQHIPLEQLPDMTADRLQSIKGFGPITAPAIVHSIAELWGTIRWMLDQGFNLIRTPSSAEAPQTPVAGLSVVFTGSMESGTRDDMIAQARSLGANVQSSVSKATDYLVCGAKVGESKLSKARSNGHTQVITESEWLGKIAAS